MGSYLRGNLPRNANFWQVGVLDAVLSEYLDKYHNFTNLIFMTSSLELYTITVRLFCCCFSFVRRTCWSLNKWATTVSGRLCARTGYVTKALTFGWNQSLWFHRPFICRATLEFYCVKKSRCRTTAQAKLSFVFNLLLVLFIPRPEWSVQLFSAFCIGTDYETGDETELVLSKTECGGKRFRTKRYLTFFNTCGGIFFNKVFVLSFYFRCG